jgi:tetratricopeptide (TPR) repeat protein
MSKTGNVRLTLGSAVELRKVSFDVNYTLDLLTQLTPLNRVSIGVRFYLGDQGRQALSDRVDELYLAGLNAYSQGNNNEARYYWEEALQLNPRFTPAMEGLAIIRRSQELEDRINDMQRLDF